MRLRTRHVVRAAAIVVLASAGSGLLLRAQLPQTVGTWAPLGAVAQSRVGAAAVSLSDGRTAIAGGINADGLPTDDVALYDPAANSFTSLGHLIGPRVGHTATLLKDGRLLVAGGTMDNLLSADLELFDPSSGSSTLAALMTQPRTGHAAARLSDGKILIVGGSTTGGVVLGSAELFDPATGTVTTVPASLQFARVGASATTLIDNRVLIAGGRNGTVDLGYTDLGSAEIYNAFSQTFTLVDTQLSVARSGHTALLLPHNNSVLISGGTSADVQQARADLFLPAEFPDPFSYGTGRFAATGGMTAARSGAVGGPTHVEGYAFVMGGGSADAEAYRFATIKTDRDDYGPGEPAIITGSGWQPLEKVTLLFQEDPAVHGDYTFDVTADSDGNIFHDKWAPEQHDLGVRFYLMASDSQSRAQTTFTDGNVRVRAIFSPSGPASAPISWELFDNPTCTGTSSSSGSVSAGTTGIGASLPDATDLQSLRVTAGAVAGYSFSTWGNGNFVTGTFTATSNPGCLKGAGSTQNTTVTYTAVAAATKLAVASVNGGTNPTYGNSFSVVIQSQNASSTATNVTADTAFTLSVAIGTGALTGTVSGTILAGQSAATVTGVSYSKAENGVSLTATRTSGDTLTPGTSAPFNVLPRPLSVTAVNKSKTYGQVVTFDATTPSTDFSVVGLVNADTVDSVTLASTGAAATATVAGAPYVIAVSTAVGTGLGNYTISYVNGSLTVDPAALTITAANKTKTYGQAVVFDQTSPSTDFSVVGLVNTDTVTSVTLASAGAATGASISGSPYVITVSAAVGTGLGNYTISYVNGSLTVDPAVLTITAASKTKTYGGTVVFDETSPSADFSVVGLVNTDTVGSVTLTSAGAAATATVAGSPYAIVPSDAVGTGLGNYTIGYVNGSLTVDPAVLTITAASKTKTYGGTVVFDETSPSADFGVVGLVNTDTVDSVTLASAGAAATATVAGSPYAIVPSDAVGTGLGSYTIGYVNGSLTVDPAALTITAASKTKTYGGTVVFDETSPSADFSVVGLVNIDTVDSVTLASAGAAATATVADSPYVITVNAAVGTGLANYTISYVNGSLTVDPAVLTITAASKTKTYGGTVVFDETSPSADFGVVGLVNTDTVDSVTLTSAGAAATATVAGSPYAIVPSDAVGTGLGNYTIGYVNGSLTVDPAALTITAASKTKTYGGTVVFDETSPSADFSVVGLVNTDTVGSVTLTSAGAAATATVAGSPYAIVPSDAVGTGLGNYTIGYVNGSLTVDPAALTITAASKTKTYGGTVVFDQTTPSTDFSVVGLVNADTVDSVTLASTGAAATATVAGSPYVITVNTAVGTGLANYAISYVNGSLTVDPAVLTITAASKTKTYGGTVVFDETTPSTDFSVVGLVNADTVGSVTLTSAGAAATATVAGSPYAIVPSNAVGTGLGNYTIGYVNGSLTVDPAALSVTAVNKSKIYGQAVAFDESTPSTDFTVVGLVNADTVGSVTLASAGAAAGAAVSGSPYVIMVSAAVGTGLPNYTINYVNGLLAVTPAALTITASSHTITFNDPVPSITPAYSGFVAGDDPTDLTPQPNCNTTYTVGSLIGNYPSNCLGAASGNYTFTYVPGTVNVLTACSVFNGFLPPIGGAVELGTGGSFASPVRAFKLNSTIPVKFSATCFGAPLTTGVHTLQAIKYSDSTTFESPVDATPTDAATTGNQFRLTGSEWHFNLSTKGLGNSGQGTWLLKATLFDGSSYSVWVSIKK